MLKKLKETFNFMVEKVVRHGPVQAIVGGLGTEFEFLTPRKYFLGVKPSKGPNFSCLGTDVRAAVLTERILTVSGTMAATFMLYASPAYIAVPGLIAAYAGIKTGAFLIGSAAGNAVVWVDKKLNSPRIEAQPETLNVK